MRPVIALLLLLSGILLESIAQPAACNLMLEGRVLESGTNRPIESASVYLSGTSLGQRTDSNGYFKINGICPNDYVLIIQHLNHEPERERIRLSTRQTYRTVYLHCHTDTLHHLIVRGARLHWEDIGVSHRLDHSDLLKTSGLPLGKVLERINGVQTLSTGNSIQKPVIRGLHSNRILIINHGLRQEGQQWGNEHAPEIDPFMAKQIEVVKGAQSIRYGSDMIGGIILINPNPLQAIQGIRGEYNMGLFQNGRQGVASLLLEGRHRQSPLFWRVQGTWKRAGNMAAPDYFLKNTGLREANYSAALAYTIGRWQLEWFHSFFDTDLGIFAGSHIGNLSDLYRAFQSPRPIDSAGFSYTIGFPYQDVRHRMHRIKATHILKPGNTLRILYGYQHNTRKEYDKTLNTRQDDGTYKPALHFELYTQHLEVLLEQKSSNRRFRNLGVQGFFQQNAYFGSYFIPNYQRLNGGFFLTEKRYRGPLSFEGGLRYDIHQFGIEKWENNQLLQASHRYHAPAATLALRYQFRKLTFHAQAGTAWRAPFVNELYSDGVHHSAVSYEIGDRRLGTERSYQTELTVDWKSESWNAEITVFSNYIRDYIYLQPILPATLTIRGAFPTFRFQQNDAWFRGVETSIALKMHERLQGHVQGNFTLANRSGDMLYLVGIPPARADLELEYTVIQKSWLQLQWVNGFRWVDKQRRVSEGSDYVPPPPSYYLFHTELSGNWHIRSLRFNTHAGIQNLLNKAYRDYMNRNRYFADEQGINGFLRIQVPFCIKN